MFYFKNQSKHNGILSDKFYETSFPHNIENRHANNFIYLDRPLNISIYDDSSKIKKLNKLYSYLKKYGHVLQANYLKRIIKSFK